MKTVLASHVRDVLVDLTYESLSVCVECTVLVRFQAEVYTLPISNVASHGRNVSVLKLTMLGVGIDI